MWKNTQVGLSNPTIKKIVIATIGGFKGRKVAVDEVGSNFTYDIYLEMGSPTVAFIADAMGRRARATRPPSMARPMEQLNYEAFDGGSCVVVWHRGSSGSVTIYIPELDGAALSVATDALIEKDKRKAAATLAHCGPYAGIAMAVAEAHAKTLGKGEAGAPKKSAARLTRDIEAIIGRRL